MPSLSEDLRGATISDVGPIAVVHRSAFRDALPWIAELHTPQEDLDFFERVVEQQEVVVAEIDGEVAGFAAWSDNWLNQLYVAPPHQRKGLGKQLLERAKQAHKSLNPPAGFMLWTFQRNHRARRFYEINGLVPVEFTGGVANEENEPDIRYAWRPPLP